MHGSIEAREDGGDSESAERAEAAGCLGRLNRGKAGEAAVAVVQRALSRTHPAGLSQELKAVSAE